MKLTITTLLLLISTSVFSQLPDGTYRISKITVSGGVITAIDSTLETDPTVNPDVKTVNNTDVNHWNEAYNKSISYPSYGVLDSWINNVWIPEKSRLSISLSTSGTGSPVYNSSTGVMTIPSVAYNAGFGLTKTGSDPSATLAIDQTAIMTVQRATDSIASLVGQLNGKASTAALGNYFTKTQSDLRYPMVDGTNATGNWSIGILGNAATATKLATARTINGVSFDGTANITIPGTTYTAGTGISIVGTTITNTAPNQTVSLTAGRGIVITGTYPNFTISTVTPTVNIVARTLNSNFTISTTKEAIVTYTVTCSVTNPLLVGTSSATAFLEYSNNGGSTWLLAGQNGNSSGVGVTVTVQLTNGQTGTMSGVIPANALVRIRTTNVGTASVTYVTGQETIY